MDAKESLRIFVLGKLAVLSRGISLQLPRSRKTRALLAYLTVTARPHSRARLCSIFWPVPDDPRAALRWSLTRLRPLVDEPQCPRIIADRDEVRLELDQVSVDIASVRSLARDGTDSISTEALRQATAALEHDFLEGLDLPDCQDFQNWCTAEREEMRRLRVRLLTALVARLEDAPDEATPHARALCALDPANEGSRATLVRLLRTAGRVREADEQFRSALKDLDEFQVVSTGALRQAAQPPLQASLQTRVIDSPTGRAEPEGLRERFAPHEVAVLQGLGRRSDCLRLRRRWSAVGVGDALAQPSCLQLGKSDMAPLDRRVCAGSLVCPFRSPRPRPFSWDQSGLVG